METSINNKCKAFTSLEQSKKLAEILPPESADMHYIRRTHDFMGNPVDGKWSYPEYGNPNSKHAGYVVQNFESYEKIPCWSLAALLGVIPKPDLVQNSEGTWLVHSWVNAYPWSVGGYSNPVDACYEMIVKLKEKNLL